MYCKQNETNILISLHVIVLERCYVSTLLSVNGLTAKSVMLVWLLLCCYTSLLPLARSNYSELKLYDLAVALFLYSQTCKSCDPSSCNSLIYWIQFYFFSCYLSLCIQLKTICNTTLILPDRTHWCKMWISKMHHYLSFAKLDHNLRWCLSF